MYICMYMYVHTKCVCFCSEDLDNYRYTPPITLHTKTERGLHSEIIQNPGPISGHCI